MCLLLKTVTWGLRGRRQILMQTNYEHLITARLRRVYGTNLTRTADFSNMYIFSIELTPTASLRREGQELAILIKEGGFDKQPRFIRLGEDS